jgi:hypothetical protein
VAVSKISFSHFLCCFLFVGLGTAIPRSSAPKCASPGVSAKGNVSGERLVQAAVRGVAESARVLGTTRLQSAELRTAIPRSPSPRRASAGGSAKCSDVSGERLVQVAVRRVAESARVLGGGVSAVNLPMLAPGRIPVRTVLLHQRMGFRSSGLDTMIDAAGH